MANKTFHIPKSAIVETEDNVSILEGKQQTITTDASAVATLTNTDGFKAAHYSIAAERDGEVTTTTTTTTTTVTGSGGLDADTKLLLNANYIYDESFSKRDITLNNTEVVRKGYAFDGNGGISATSSDFTFGTGNFTIEFWLKKSSSPSNKQRLFGIGTFNQSGQLSIMLNNSNGGIILRKGTGSAQSEILSDSTNVCGDTWHHIAITRSSTSLKLFIDGVQKQSVTDSTDFSQSALEIGEDTGLDSQYSSGQYDYSGYLADIRISKGTARYTADFDELVTTKDSNHVLILTGETTDQSDSTQSLTFSGAHPTAKHGQGSFYFDGSSHIDASVPFSPGTGDFTIEAWINLDSVTTSQNVVETIACSENWYQTGYNGGWLFIADFRGNTNTIVFYGTNGNPASGGSASAVTATNCGLQANKWHHVAVCRESGTLTIYIDGVAKKSESSYTFSVTQDLTHIGRKQPNHHYGQADYFNGYIDDLRISKGVARYTAAFNNDLPTAPLETEDSRTKLLLNTNSALQDFEIGRMALAPTYAGDTKVVRRGYKFDGSNDYISMPQSSDFTFDGDFTIEFWANKDSDGNGSGGTPGYDVLIGCNNAGGANNGGWFIEWSNTRGFNFYDGDGNNTTVMNWDYDPNGTGWNHVAFARDGNSCRLFVNGELKKTTTYSNTISCSNSLFIGRTNNGSWPYNGYMSDIRITKGEAVYTSAFTPPESLTAGTNTKLLLAGGEEDESSSEHSLTFSGAHPTAKFGDGSYYFDGTGDYISVLDSDLVLDGEFTIEMWINNQEASSDALFFVSDKSTTYPSYADLFFGPINNGGNWRIRVLGTDVGSGIGAVPVNQWFHVAVTRDSSNLVTLWQNGTAIHTISNKSGDVTLVGGQATLGLPSNYMHTGYIDDFRISSTARYTASFDVPTSELGGGTSTTTTTETTTTTTTGSSDVVLTKVHLVHDGSNVYFTEYGRTATDDDFLELSASYDAGVAKLHASTTSGSATLELTKKEFDFSTD